MAIVTGGVWTPQRAPFLANKALKMIFKLSSAASNGGALVVVPDDVEVTPDEFGQFEVDLQVTTNLLGRPHFEVEFQWLNGAGIPIGFENPPWKIRVPPEGGDIGLMIDAETNPDLIWAGAVAPSDPTPLVGWINTTNSTFYEWE